MDARRIYARGSCATPRWFWSSMAPQAPPLLELLAAILFSSCAGAAWIKSGYWHYPSNYPISDIDSSLFTHLICAFADINSSTYGILFPHSQNHTFAAFSATVRRKNPSLTTLLSVGGSPGSAYASLVASPATRNSFIQSATRTARHYGFQGIDIAWPDPNTTAQMTGLGLLLQEWRAAVGSSNVSSNSTFILTMMCDPSSIPNATDESVVYPAKSMSRDLDWVHLKFFNYFSPTWYHFTAAQAALYNPTSKESTDYRVRAWVERGLPTSKMVLCLPFYGYAWRLDNLSDTAIGAPASGPGHDGDGSMDYKDIIEYIRGITAGGRAAVSVYDATYVVNYFSVDRTWIGFDGEMAIAAKVSYAKKKGMRGYNAWHVARDDNWNLSKVAAGGRPQTIDTTVGDGAKHHRAKRIPSWLVILIIVMISTLLIGFMIYYYVRRTRTSRGNQQTLGSGMFSLSHPILEAFSYSNLEEVTNEFSDKLGEGGFGPVYKGKWKGEDIAVKRLSKTSGQGLEQFRNELVLTAKLQHVNLVRIIGYCTEREENMIIYEYMPNNSLDSYIFDRDGHRRQLLDWGKRIEIIDGITNGLMYLHQFYSRDSIIHRDLKASNILLDNEMKPKISDLGLAMIFKVDGNNGNGIGRVRRVGTPGYIPPDGWYTQKSDVYSFGVLLLEIISGKKGRGGYGDDKELSLSQYANELWRAGRGLEFMDALLDDATMQLKLLTCLEVGLRCVEEESTKRPSMPEVASLLRNEGSRPTSWSTWDMHTSSRARDKSEGNNGEDNSLNIVSFSEMHPR